MKKKKGNRLFAFCLLCVASLLIVSCGSKQVADEEEIMGRVSAVSEEQITISVFEMSKEKKQPDEVSGGAFEGKERPEGTPPADMQQGERPEGTPPADMQQGERPEGTPPADMQQGRNPEGNEQQDKTILISKSTKIYRQNGEEKIEISISDLNPGDTVMVAMDGENADSITIREGEKRSRKMEETNEK